MTRSLRSLGKSKTIVAKPFETTVSNGRLDRPDRGFVLSRRQVGSCAQPEHIRDWDREEQELRGGRQSLCLANRASSRESPAPTTFVIDLFSTSTDVQRFFLNRCIHCAGLDPFSEDAVFFVENSGNLVHLGKWSNSRGSVLTTGVLALNCQKPSTSTKRDTTPGIASFELFRQMSSRQRQCVCRRLFASRQSMHQVSSVKIPFCLAKPLGSYLWKLSGLKNLISTCVVLDIHHCAFGPPWRKAVRLVFEVRSGRVCFHNLGSHVFRCHGKRGFCSFREGHKHSLLRGNLTRQSEKPPARLIAFLAGLLIDP